MQPYKYHSGDRKSIGSVQHDYHQKREQTNCNGVPDRKSLTSEENEKSNNHYLQSDRNMSRLDPNNNCRKRGRKSSFSKDDNARMSTSSTNSTNATVHDKLANSEQEYSEAVGIKFASDQLDAVKDKAKVESRLKQIQYGKNTIGYDNYLSLVPKDKRHRDQSIHPRTPNPYEDHSKRQFDGLIKAWRRMLHKWDNLDQIKPTEVTDEKTYQANVMQPVGAPEPLNAKKHKAALKEAERVSKEKEREELKALAKYTGLIIPEDEHSGHDEMTSKRARLAETGEVDETNYGEDLPEEIFDDNLAADSSMDDDDFL